MGIFSDSSGKHPMIITALWSGFGACGDSLQGVIIDGCETARSEAENVGVVDVLASLDAPGDAGIWKWTGTLNVWRSFEGEYDCDYTGTWEKLCDLPDIATVPAAEAASKLPTTETFP